MTRANFPRITTLAKELNVTKAELINILISFGYSRLMLRGNFILSTRMYADIMRHYQPKKIKRNKKRIAVTDSAASQGVSRQVALSVRKIEPKELRLPRLLAAAKEFNIGQDTIIDFLVGKGFSKEELQPTAKISRKMYEALSLEFKGEILEDVSDTETEGTNNARLTIGFDANGKLVVKLIDESGHEYETDLEKFPAGIFFTGFNRYSELIHEFEELINDPNTSEADLQKFLEAYPEFIKENDFKEVFSQAVIHTDDDIKWKADFFLVPHDQFNFCKILELKLPSEKMGQRSKSGHATFSKKLLNAIQQLKEYADAFQSNHTKQRFKEKYKVEVFYPSLQLIIGRKGDIKIQKDFMRLQKENNVTVSDWDSFLHGIKRKFT